MTLGPIDKVSVVVDDLDLAVELYREGVGLHGCGTASLSPALLQAVPVLAGRRVVDLAAPGDNRAGALRLIELPGARTPATLATTGWAAAELIVADAGAAAERATAAGLQMIAEPAPVGAGGGLRAAQIRGPGGEGIYLTQVDRPPPDFELPTAVAAVGRVFIAVLASHNLEVSRGAVERLVAGRRVTDHDLQVRAINTSMALPDRTRHRVSTIQLAGAAAIEVDQYPPSAASRAREGGTVGGIVCVSVRGGAAPTITTLPATDGALLELSTTNRDRL